MTLVLLGVTAGCSKKVDDARPVATPSLTLSRMDAAVGSPIDVTYRFAVAADAPPFTEDYTVFVHVLDKDASLDVDGRPRAADADDAVEGGIDHRVHAHDVRSEASVRRAGADRNRTLLSQVRSAGAAGWGEYRRAFHPGGHVQHAAACQRPLRRLPRRLARCGDLGRGGRGMAVVQETGHPVVSKSQARRQFYPRSRSNPWHAFTEPQKVEVRLGDAVVDSFSLPAGRRELRRISLTAAQLGSEDTVDVVVAVDKTFVPASVPKLKSLDPRELGVRVFHAFVEPKQ